MMLCKWAVMNLHPGADGSLPSLPAYFVRALFLGCLSNDEPTGKVADVFFSKLDSISSTYTYKTKILSI